MQEVHRLALEDIESNLDYDTRIVEVNFQDASFLRELRRRGYNNIAGTGDVENFIDLEVHPISELPDAEVVCCFNKKLKLNPREFPGKYFYGCIAKDWDEDAPGKIAKILGDGKYNEIKVRATTYRSHDFNLPLPLAFLMSTALTVMGIVGPKYAVKAERTFNYDG